VPVGSGPDAARRLAASLVAPEHVDGCVLLLAFAEAGSALEPAARAAPRGPAGVGALVASVAPYLAGLTGEQGAQVRHCALLLTRNWSRHGTMYRTEPPSLATDPNGYLYETTNRQRLASRLDQVGIATIETALAILEPARFLQMFVRDIREGTRPAPDLVAAVLADLPPETAAHAARACWQVVAHR
jgi:hypothetical protein